MLKTEWIHQEDAADIQLQSFISLPDKKIIGQILIKLEGQKKTGKWFWATQKDSGHVNTEAEAKAEVEK